MAFFFKTGALYHIKYSAWKTNPTHIYVFILFGSPVTPKIHALNIGAKQLSMLDKAKIVHTIVRLSKIPNISTYSGALLYRIFLTYLKPQVQKCYRTYFHMYVTGASLINYGLNKAEDFQSYDMRVYNPQLLEEAKRDFIIRILNMYSRRGVELKSVQNAFAKIQKQIPKPTPEAIKDQTEEKTPQRVSDEPMYKPEEQPFSQIPKPPTAEELKKEKSETEEDELDKIGY